MATISEALAIAVQHHQGGRLQVAEQICRQILQVEPNEADAWHLLGVIAHQLGKHEASVEYLGRAISVDSANAVFCVSLGNAYRALQRTADAVACYCRAVDLAPGSAEARYRLGNAMREQGKLDEAIACYRWAVQLKPDFAEAHNNLGVALKDRGELDEAVACYRRVVQLRPNDVEPNNNLGVALRDLGRHDEAVACCHRALQLNPDDAEVYDNLGNALKDQGKLDEALACYRRALQLKPDFAEARLNRSLASLLTGDFPGGWDEYQWRWKTKQCQRRDFSQALWDGQPLEGRTILLHAEQGLGDTIQFIRYASRVKQAGARVLVECQKPLLQLLTGCRGVDELIGRGDTLPPFDVHAPLLALPGIFRTSLETIPAEVPYLFADPGLMEHWRRELSPIAGFKIGIAWRGSPKHLSDRTRSIPLNCFESLASLPGVSFISLQKGAGAEQLQQVAERFPVTELGSRLDEASGAFMDTAAVLKTLDLLITCDTAIAHLAGALGAAVWVALPLVPDWRWLLDRDDSPWYPTMRLFRQIKPGDWASAFERIKTALATRLSSQE